MSTAPATSSMPTEATFTFTSDNGSHTKTSSTIHDGSGRTEGRKLATALSVPLGGPPRAAAAAEYKDDTVKSIRLLGIRAPKPYDPKSEPNFDEWLNQGLFDMSVSKISNEKRTSYLLLLFDTDCFKAACHINIHNYRL